MIDDIVKPKKLAVSQTTQWQVMSRKFWRRLGMILAGLALAGLLFWLASNYLANFLLHRGSVALDRQDWAGAEQQWRWAKHFGHQDLFDRAIADLKLQALNQFLVSPNQADLKSLQAKVAELYGGAIQSALAARDDDSANYLNWFALGRVYEAGIPLKVAGALDQARLAYQTAAEKNPKWPNAWVALARIEQSAGQLQLARQDLERALVLKPNDPDALLALAQLDYNGGRLPEALASAEAAIKSQPNNPVARFVWGFLSYQAGHFDEALKAFDQVLTANPNSADAKYFLGLTLAKLDRRVEAIALFQALAGANPGNQELKTILLNLQTGRPALEASAPKPQK